MSFGAGVRGYGVGALGEWVIIQRRGEPEPSPGCRIMPESEALFTLLRWNADPSTRRWSDEVVRVGGHQGMLPDARERARFPQLAESLLRSGAVVIWVVPPTPYTAPGRPERPSTPTAPQAGRRRTWLEIRLTDDAERPVAEERVVAIDDEGVRFERRTNPDGIARMEGLLPGEAEVSFPSIDGREWAARGRDLGHGSSEIRLVHRARFDECMSRISHRYGFRSPNTLYHHECNSDLHAMRPNPHLLAEGDLVSILEHDTRSEIVTTGRRHESWTPCPLRWLRLVLHDSFCQPLRNEPCVVEGTGVSAASGQLQTDGEGTVEVLVGPSTGAVSIRTQSYQWEVAIAHLAPVVQVADGGVLGAHQRLHNLGHPVVARAAERADDETASYDREVWRFQRLEGLRPHGALDAATVDAAQRIFIV